VQEESGGGRRLGLRVGLNTGEVVAGVQASLSYTVIGDTVNTAARLMQMAQSDEVLISGALYESIRPLLPAGRVRSRGEVALRGKSETLRVYSIKL
jgi:class 3 adenylate cyclase